ncbi:MAG: hypothetical protein IKV07_03870 [Bacteroidaceae bacterium]|nr:hypothetical protein [Bacteroidaceae bacterium]
MKKLLLSITCMLFAGITMAQNALDFTFTRNDSGVAVAVSGAEGVTATIEATSASNAWNTGGAMANRTDVLCQNTNTSATSADSPITYTLTVEGLNAEIAEVAFTHVTVNSGGNLQPSNNIDVRHCNFILEANGEVAGTLTDQNIWIPAESTDKTITFNDLSVAADGTLTIKLTLYKGTNNNGCFYGLTKITLVEKVAVEGGDEDGDEDVEEVEEKSFLTQMTANDLMSKTEATYIAIQNLSYTNGYWFVGNTGAAPYSKAEFTAEAIFVWEPAEAGVAGSYRLKKVNGEYMQATSPKDFGTIDNAAVFTATNPTSQGSGATLFNGDGDSNLYVAGSNDANIVRFVKGNNWINIQNANTGTPTYNSGTGGWTIHYVYEVTEVNEYTVNIDNAGYATFFAPVNVIIPENVKAYYITSAGISADNVTLTQIENIIPANTAVILEGEEGEYSFEVSQEEVDAIEGNLLKGTLTNRNIVGAAYVLANDEETGVGLYQAELTSIALSTASGSVQAFMNKANEAYLPANAIPEGANAGASLHFSTENTTAVEKVESRNEKVEIYDLTGRKVKNITNAGIYIVNGCKVLVK